MLVWYHIFPCILCAPNIFLVTFPVSFWGGFFLVFGFTIYRILFIRGLICNQLFLVYFTSDLVILSLFMVIFGLYLFFVSVISH